MKNEFVKFFLPFKTISVANFAKSDIHEVILF